MNVPPQEKWAKGKPETWKDCYGYTVHRDHPCPTCNGTGEVHSHNPICWDCKGSGRLTTREGVQRA
jgi:DnaJ-class molecular chaperone